MTALAFAALLIAVPTGIIGAVCMIRLGRDLDRESEHGFRLPESKGERDQRHAARSLKL